MEKEEAQANVLRVYLPPELTSQQVRAMVREILAAGISGMGDVMSRLVPRIRGRFDGRTASRIVREELP